MTFNIDKVAKKELAEVHSVKKTQERAVVLKLVADYAS